MADWLNRFAPLAFLYSFATAGYPEFGRERRVETWMWVAAASVIVILAALLAFYFFIIVPAPTGTTTIHS